MERDERVGLRLSIAMHVALLAAFGTTGGSAEQNVQTTPVQLVVLPAQSPKPAGEQPTDATDECGMMRSMHSTASVKLDFKIAKAPLETELRSFGDQTGLEYALPTQLLAYKWGSEVRGSYTPAEAADLLLEGTDLCGDWIAGGLVIERCDAAGSKKRDKPSFGLVLVSSPNPCDENSAQTFNRSRIDLPGLK